MAMMIKYKAQCFYCKKWFEKGTAFLQRDRVSKRWFCHCRDCFDTKKEAEKIILARSK